MHESHESVSRIVLDEEDGASVDFRIEEDLFLIRRIEPNGTVSGEIVFDPKDAAKYEKAISTLRRSIESTP